MPLLRAMAVSLARLLPADFTFTVLTYDKAGQMAGYVSTSPQPVLHRPKTRTKKTRSTWRKR